MSAVIPNEICQIIPDAGLSALYHLLGPGLPDRWNIKQDEEFAGQLGMSRAERKRDARLPKEQRLIAKHFWQQHRRANLLGGLGKARYLEIDRNFPPALASWEMLVFHRIDPDWYVEMPRLVSLSKGDQALIAGWLAETLANDPDLAASPQMVRDYLSRPSFVECIQGLAATIWARVRVLETLGEALRLETADAVWAMTAFLGMPFFYALLTAQPELASYYGHIRHLTSRIEAQSNTGSVFASSKTEKLGVALVAMYQEIKRLAEEGAAEDCSLKEAVAIFDLLDEKLEGFSAQVAELHLSSMKLQLAYVKEIMGFIAPIIIADLRNESFTGALENAWYRHMLDGLSRQVESSFLVEEHDRMATACRAMQQELEAVYGVLELAKGQQLVLEQCVTTSDFRKRGELLAGRAKAAEALLQAQKAAEAAEEKSLALCLPPGLALESMPDISAPVDFMRELHSSALAALSLWNNQRNTQRNQGKKVADEFPDRKRLRADFKELQLALTEPQEVEERAEPDAAEALVDAGTELLGKSLVAIAEAVALRYPNTLHFTPAAKRSMQDTTYRDLGLFQETLEILASKVYPLYIERKAGQPQIQALFTPLRIGFKPKTSRPYQQTMLYKGRAANLNKHLSLGTARDQSRTLRIHFDWDTEDKCLVIHHAGQHLLLAE